jgi:hypothetical protein
MWNTRSVEIGPGRHLEVNHPWPADIQRTPDEIGSRWSIRSALDPALRAAVYQVEPGPRRPLSTDLVTRQATPWHRVIVHIGTWSLPVIAATLGVIATLLG